MRPGGGHGFGLGKRHENGAVSWLLADNEGTVRDVAVLSGGTTTIVDHLVYDAFGNIAYETPNAAAPRFTYTGQQLDAATGLYNYRARWYDAEMGRFMSQDPAGFSAGDANLYRYTGNDPVNSTDPTGEFMTMGQYLIKLQAGSIRADGSPVGGPSERCPYCDPPVGKMGSYDYPEDLDGGGPSEGPADYGDTAGLPWWRWRHSAEPAKRRTGRLVGMGAGRSTPYRRSAHCFWKPLKVAIPRLRRRKA